MIGDHFLKTFAPEVPYENTLKVVLEVQVWLLLFDFLGVVVVLLGGVGGIFSLLLFIIFYDWQLKLLAYSCHRKSLPATQKGSKNEHESFMNSA